ncbi:nuclear transport factor 2 family protein [Rugosimonospora acidiphila]|uniref:nuclear transport factor 2 family protein n=1 Tax=Rugosimonospora acidiphila TaxID=556531 RepID=UPI0031E5A033
MAADSVDPRQRPPAEVFEDHLRLAQEGRLDEDLARNVSPDCVLLERRGVFHGREGARELARYLTEEVPHARYGYTRRLVEGRFCMLEWTADSDGARVRDGVDSYVIEDGWIVAQTIRYTVEPKTGGES